MIQSSQCGLAALTHSWCGVAIGQIEHCSLLMCSTAQCCIPLYIMDLSESSRYSDKVTRSGVRIPAWVRDVSAHSQNCEKRLLGPVQLRSGIVQVTWGAAHIPSATLHHRTSILRLFCVADPHDAVTARHPRSLFYFKIFILYTR